MKSKRSIMLTLLLIAMSLLLVTACTSEAPAEAVPAEAQQQQQPQSEAKPSEVPVAQEPPAEAVPAEPTPAEETHTAAVKPSEAAPEPAAEKQKDKSSLQLEGSGIEKAVTLTLEELKAMEASLVEADVFSLNSYGTKEYFHFKGVKLSAILQSAGLKKEAAAVTVIASDGYKLELTVEQALREDYIDEQDPGKKYPVIIAWHENGKDYDELEGYPFRLVIGQKEPGDVNKPQWVMNIAKITVN